MASDWKNHKVGELADSISVTHSFDKKRLIFLNTSDILRGKVLHNSYKDVGSLPGQAKKTIKKDDILLSEIRPANGRYAFIDFEAEDYVVSTKLMVIRAREKILPRFLFYFLTNKSITNWLQHLAESRSGTFPQITFDQIADLNVKLPNRDEQEKIIAYIDPIDEKIELNHQMNTTLEKIGQALFKRWFIDFEFPNKKGKLYKSSGGKMVDSELGEIPKGWTAGKFSDLVQVTAGKGLKRDEFVFDGHFSVLGANGELGKTDKYLFDEKLILTGRVGTLGTVYLIRDKCWISDNVLISKPIQEENYYYAFFVIRQFDFQSLNRGSTQPLITQTDLKNQGVVIPNKEILVMFHKILAGLYEKLDLNNYESKYLSQIRDSLLPRLMSGQIRVPAG